MCAENPRLVAEATRHGTWSVYGLNFDAIMPAKTNIPDPNRQTQRKPRRVLQMHMGSSRTYGFADKGICCSKGAEEKT